MRIYCGLKTMSNHNTRRSGHVAFLLALVALMIATIFWTARHVLAYVITCAIIAMPWWFRTIVKVFFATKTNQCSVFNRRNRRNLRISSSASVGLFIRASISDLLPGSPGLPSFDPPASPGGSARVRERPPIGRSPDHLPQSACSDLITGFVNLRSWRIDRHPRDDRDWNGK